MGIIKKKYKTKQINIIKLLIYLNTINNNKKNNHGNNKRGYGQ